MESVTETHSTSKAMLWTGRIMSFLPSALLLLDAAGKLAKPAQVVEATIKLGYPENVIFPIGIILLICVIIYLIPKTSVLGAILLTGYLGGAVATHVRAGGSLFEILFPAIFGALIWGGIYLRDERIRALIPLKK